MLQEREVFGRIVKYDPDTCDELVIHEQHRSYKYLFSTGIKDPVVLDIGGNRGYFASYAYSQGAKKVYSVEPEPVNCSIYKMNAPEATLYEGGVGTEDGFFNLYINEQRNKGLHSTVQKPIKGRSVIEVKKFNFWNIIRDVKPDLIKIDCEGAEYFLGMLENDFPDHVKAIAVELDVNRWVKKKLLEEMKAGNYENAKDNVLYTHYHRLREQFPKVLKDTSADLRKFAWNILYCGARND